ncbi:c-type cytochrome [Sulfitobacter sp. M57]|uniref:c-type cytochrome n=1 Tax=unclassified Sulfitobacter TaxID=196795 RepID=UPI0023E29CCE|nr:MULTISPECIES: c-type cytochrome [unclassified Sulfitobacter]MDF3415969.1 c-type cytochrome [Sulfitobacter sp. KE5]MDF3423449.1 c-type cytochrome [Sulfitobacter sp. KE43]MDF3434515.1 c-type cytochrome [Sulfitobacter sp. KE42]MDF3460155.1 c-type cytochrome [Sulfitobacter sp. S74]MDF3464053.1 c-type cytochrome [Sulfitobacter sp. Ks18]
MSKFLKSTALAGALALTAVPALAEKFGLGRAALPDEIAAWDGDIRPDGTGLPVGSGDALIGEEIFATQCAACHGDFAEGIDNWPKLAGGADTLDHEDPLKTVGSYWPYLSTAFDYIKRSMPYGNAGTLSDDDVYSIVAYILYSNDLIEDDFVLSNESFFDVDMPNADGFILDNRAETEYSKWTGEPCMENCKSEVKVTMRARVLDVTPQEETAVADSEEAQPVEVAATSAAAPAEETAAVETVAAFDADLAEKGEKVFKKCKSCHQLGAGAKNRTGPILTGIVGQAAGAVEGFKYSKPMQAAGKDGLLWTEGELAAFLAKPKKYMKGTKMSFAGLKKEADQAAVIEYLKSVTE